MEHNSLSATNAKKSVCTFIYRSKILLIISCSSHRSHVSLFYEWFDWFLNKFSSSLHYLKSIVRSEGTNSFSHFVQHNYTCDTGLVLDQVHDFDFIKYTSTLLNRIQAGFVPSMVPATELHHSLFRGRDWAYSHLDLEN